MSRELFRVYVDEAGDRGWGGSSSSIFNLSAVMIRDSDADNLKDLRNSLCVDLGKPPNTVLHWSENIKTHGARKFVSTTLGGAPITVANVVVHKKSLMGSGTALTDPDKQYNYAVRRLLERVSWHVDELGGEAIITFAHIRRFPYEKLNAYFDVLKSVGSKVRWTAIRKWKIDQPNRIPLLQISDIAAGCTHSAFRPDKFGAYEAEYLMNLVPTIYMRRPAHVSSYGMNLVGSNGCTAEYPWWDGFCDACAAA